MANNYVLDYDPAGLHETLDTLAKAQVRTAGRAGPSTRRAGRRRWSTRTAGHEEFRPDLVLMYLAALTPTGELERLRMVPFRQRGPSLRRASPGDAEWLAATIRSVSAGFRTDVELEGERGLLIEPR